MILVEPRQPNETNKLRIPVKPIRDSGGWRSLRPEHADRGFRGCRSPVQRKDAGKDIILLVGGIVQWGVDFSHGFSLEFNSVGVVDKVFG